MNVDELYRLSEWYTTHYSTISGLYNSLISPIHYNSTQPDKRPVQTELEALSLYLREVEFGDLSIQQIDMLRKLDVLEYLGMNGVQYLDETIRTSNFDPATALSKLNEANAKLSSINNSFISYQTALRSLDLIDTSSESMTDHVIIRVGFQNEASIDTVTDWKSSAGEWYEIIRGIALAIGEAPEDTKIAGAATGSIILVLVGTLKMTTIMAQISKTIATAAIGIIGIGVAREHLRQQGILSEIMKGELDKQQAELKSKTVEKVLAEVSNQIIASDGGVKVGLANAIKKLLTFNENGGSVDFVSPPEPTEVDGDAEPNAETILLKTALTEVRKAIHEAQVEREAVKRLTSRPITPEEG